jgi:hypothetical protein
MLYIHHNLSIEFFNVTLTFNQFVVLVSFENGDFEGYIIIDLAEGSLVIF